MCYPPSWRAKWSWPETPQPGAIVRCLFRRAFQMRTPGQFRACVSADSRYKLYLDGGFLGEGPAVADLWHYNYELYGFEEPLFLVPGRHVLAVDVLSYGDQGPQNESHFTGALIVEGAVLDAAGNELVDLRTPGEWRAQFDESYGVHFEKPISFWPLSFMEDVDRRKAVLGWTELDYDDTGWTPLAPLTVSYWLLEARDIPLVVRRPQRFGAVVRCEGVVSHAEWEALIRGESALTIPPRQKCRVILDQGTIITAYPQLTLTSGKGARIILEYAEAFSEYDEKPLHRRQTEFRLGMRPEWFIHLNKKIRDDTSGVIVGCHDRFIAHGARDRYEPFRFRTFRYLQLEVETEEEALRLEDLAFEETGYPLVLRADFDCDDDMLNRLFSMCWHTLRLCTHESYIDTPYYEQLQYLGDARTEALVGSYLAGEQRLWRRLLRLVNDARLGIGLTPARYPQKSQAREVFIPTFSLYYVSLLADYHRHFGDSEFVRGCLPGATAVLEWFAQQSGPDGLLGKLPHWSFIDFVPQWEKGDPTRRSDYKRITPNATINLLHLLTLQDCARLLRSLGAAEAAARLEKRGSTIQETLRQKFWDEGRGLFLESPQLCEFSEHANALAILTGTTPADALPRVVEQMTMSGDIIRCAYFFQFFLAQAYAQIGRVDLMLERLHRQWQQVFDLHLTTVPGYPDTERGASRCDCAAWASWPAWWLLAWVLGVRPLEPGFARVRIQPQLGPLRQASGSVPTPNGKISIRVTRSNTEWTVEAETPPRVPWELVTPSGGVLTFAGGKRCYREHITDR